MVTDFKHPSVDLTEGAGAGYRCCGIQRYQDFDRENDLGHHDQNGSIFDMINRDLYIWGTTRYDAI